MVRTPKRKPGSRSYKNYNDDKMEEALTKIVNGEMSILGASKLYKISYGTLHNRYNGKHGAKVGAPSVFSHEDEMSFLTAALKCGQWGFPLTLMDLRFLITISISM